MRIFVGLAFAICASVVLAQDYTERWRVVTAGSGQELIFWGRPQADSNDAILLVGNVSHVSPNDLRQPITMKLTADGDEVWQTRGVAGANISVRDLNVDAAGNPYFATFDSATGDLTARSLSGTDGAPRWERTFTGIPSDFNNNRDGSDLIVKSVGNSTFVYFAVTQSNNTIRLVRLNPANGQILFTATVNGTLNRNRSHSLEVDATGNVIMMLQNIDAIVTKRSQSLALVWNRVLVGTEDCGIALHPTTGEIGAVSAPSAFTGFTTLEVLDPVNGTPRRSATGLDHPTSAIGVTELFGHPSGAWYFGGRDAFGTRALSILTPTLRTQSQRTLQFDFPSADSSGMLHGPLFDRPAVGNWPRFTTFDPLLGGRFIGSVGFDSKDRLILASSVDGTGVVVQYDQKFLAGTDTFAEPFIGALEVEAPGVLANDTLSRGGSLAVATTTTKGALTLRQDGGFSYNPGATFDGNDQFSYRLTKNGISRTATCFIKRLTIASIQFQNGNSIIGSENNSGIEVTLSTGTSNLIQNIQLFANPSNLFPNSPRTLTYLPGTVIQSIVETTPVVSTSTTVTFFATLAGQTKSAVLTLKPGAFSSFAVVNAAPLYEGLTAKIRLALVNATETAREFVMVYAGEAVVSGPDRVTVPAGQTFADFTVTVPDGTATKRSRISYQVVPGVTRGSELRIAKRPHLSSAGPVDTPIYADVQNRYQVTLDLPAGSAPIAVTHSSNQADVTVPTINVGSGNTTATAAFTPRTGATNQTVTVTSRFLSDSIATQFLVRPNLLDTFTVSPAVIAPFGTTTGRVTFNWVATGNGIPVQISTSTPTLIAVPSEAMMAPGRTVLTFPIAARGRAGNAKVTVKVGLKTITKGITITSP